VQQQRMMFGVAGCDSAGFGFRLLFYSSFSCVQWTCLLQVHDSSIVGVVAAE
jgi:hypothetical protein